MKFGQCHSFFFGKAVTQQPKLTLHNSWADYRWQPNSISSIIFGMEEGTKNAGDSLRTQDHRVKIFSC